jgi:hypothetical protein
VLAHFSTAPRFTGNQAWEILQLNSSDMDIPSTKESNQPNGNQINGNDIV